MAVIDGLERVGVPLVGEANHLLVFGIAHQMGYLWADDRLPFGRCGLLLLAAGLVWAALLVGVFDYPVSMVGVEGPTRSNATPPTLALVALTAAQTGLLLALRGPCERWLHRSALVWAGVATIGTVIITILLWHMTALVAAASLTHLTGWWPDVASLSGAWWALRPVWVAVCAVLLVPLVLAVRGAERVGEPVPAGPLPTGAGVFAVARGLYLVLEEGPYAPERALRVPILAPVLLFAGLALPGALGRSAPDRSAG